MKPGDSPFDDHVCFSVILHGGAFDGDCHVWRGPPNCLPREVKLDDGRRVYHYVMPPGTHTTYAGDFRFVHLHLAETLTGGAPDIPRVIEPTTPAAPPTLGGWLLGLLARRVM